MGGARLAARRSSRCGRRRTRCRACVVQRGLAAPLAASLVRLASAPWHTRRRRPTRSCIARAGAAAPDVVASDRAPRRQGRAGVDRHARRRDRATRSDHVSTATPASIDAVAACAWLGHPERAAAGRRASRPASSPAACRCRRQLVDRRLGVRRRAVWRRASQAPRAAVRTGEPHRAVRTARCCHHVESVPEAGTCSIERGPRTSRLRPRSWRAGRRYRRVDPQGWARRRVVGRRQTLRLAMVGDDDRLRRATPGTTSLPRTTPGARLVGWSEAPRPSSSEGTAVAAAERRSSSASARRSARLPVQPARRSRRSRQELERRRR